MIVEEINVKCLVVGHGGVGKTSIVNSYLEKEVPGRYLPTIGNTISRKEYLIDDIEIRVNIWDVGGQRSFNPPNPVCFTNVDAAFLVFDLSEPKQSINELSFYLDKLLQTTDESMLFIIGNKLDLVEDRQELKKIVEEHLKLDFPLLFSSALLGNNIDEAFEILVFKFLEQWERKYPDAKFQGIAQKFLDSLNKKERTLIEILMDSSKIENVVLKKTPKPDTKKKVHTPQKDKGSPSEIIDATVLLQEKLRQIDRAKEQIVHSFGENLELVRNSILKLKSTPIDQLVETLDQTEEQLAEMMDEFEFNLEAILKIENSAVESPAPQKAVENKKEE